MDKTIIVIPYWVETALKRNKHELKDCLDYNVVRQCLSIEDILEFVSLENNNKFDFMQGMFSEALFSGWMKSADKDLLVELDSTIRPLLYNKDIINRALVRFNDTYIKDKESETFKVVDISREVVAVVIYPGFISSSTNIVTSFKIIKKLLKTMYIYSKVNTVSCHPLFGTYLKLLLKKNSRYNTFVAS